MGASMFEAEHNPDPDGRKKDQRHPGRQEWR
jgi:hypothetical protein